MSPTCHACFESPSTLRRPPSAPFPSPNRRPTTPVQAHERRRFSHRAESPLGRSSPSPRVRGVWRGVLRREGSAREGRVAHGEAVCHHRQRQGEQGGGGRAGGSAGASACLLGRGFVVVYCVARWCNAGASSLCVYCLRVRFFSMSVARANRLLTNAKTSGFTCGDICARACVSLSVSGLFSVSAPSVSCLLSSLLSLLSALLISAYCTRRSTCSR